MKKHIINEFFRSYKLDLSEFRENPPVVTTLCEAVLLPDGEWECELIIDNDEITLSSKEIKAIKKVIYPLFYTDLKRNGIPNFHWKGEKRNPLLQYKVGDGVKYNGEDCIVIYILPEVGKCGVRNPNGRLINDVKFQEIEASLLKK